MIAYCSPPMPQTRRRTGARRALERRIRDEAGRISGKYIVPPRTVDFAIMYLPTEGLFSEVNRVPGSSSSSGATTASW